MTPKVAWRVIFWIKVLVLAPLIPVAVTLYVILVLYRSGYLGITTAFGIGYAVAYYNYSPEVIAAFEEPSTAVAAPARTTTLFRFLEWACGPETVWLILYGLR